MGTMILRLAATVLVSAGCGGGTNNGPTSVPPAPTSSVGSINIVVATSGSRPDVDGYEAVIDGVRTIAVGINEDLVVSGVSADSHVVTLQGLSQHCSHNSRYPRRINVTGAFPARAQFDLVCEDGDAGRPSWSPDGQKIAYHRRIVSIGSRVRVINKDGSELIRVADGSSPTWSPDGEFVAYSDPDPFGVSLVRVDGLSPAEPLLIGSASYWAERPVWSPGGAHIAFSSLRESSSGWDIHVFAVASRQILSRALDDASYDDFPAWSPDGSRLLFLSNRDGSGEPFPASSDSFDSYVVDVSTQGVVPGSVERLTSIGSAGFSSWAPTNRIAVSVGQSIFVMDDDGSNRSFFASGSHPAWSPDGSELAFVRDGQLRLVAANGTDDRLLDDR